MKKEPFLHIYDGFDRYKSRLSTDDHHTQKTAAISPVISSGGTTETSRKTVTVHADWIAALEEGIPFFWRAIAQDRQFILRDGNVVPVERARRISKESAEHLAKHSEFLTDCDAQEILPAKLFIKENRSNYAIYENRFLYTALCYLRDFVDIRYEAIALAGDTCRTTLAVDAKFSLENQQYTYQLALTQEGREKSPSPDDDGHPSVLTRIEALRFSISQLLDTPLMLEMAKEPPVKPPITVTNVLKSDTNFHAIFLLYTYLCAYPGKGYEIREEKTPPAPLSSAFSRDLAELFLLEAFLTHCHTHHLSEGYAEAAVACRISEKNQAAEEAAAQAARFRQQCSEKSEAQYIALLEDSLYQLRQSGSYAREVAQRQEDIAARLFSLSQEVSQLTAQLAESEQRRIADAREAEDRVIQARAAAQQQAQESIRALAAQRDALRAQLEEAHSSLSQTRQQLADCREENHLLGARLVSARQRLGEPEAVDYTEKAHFDLLEAEKNAFDRFFADTWKAAKKRIIADCIKSRK